MLKPEKTDFKTDNSGLVMFMGVDEFAMMYSKEDKKVVINGEFTPEELRYVADSIEAINEGLLCD